MDQSALSPQDMLLLQCVDLDRYPITDLESGPGAAFLAECRNSMETKGWCNLDGFIRADAVERLQQEANDLLPNAITLCAKRNIYQGAIDPTAPPDDPRRKEVTHIARQLADDQISDDTQLKQLYHSDKLTDFVRKVQGKTQLYRCADQFPALNVVNQYEALFQPELFDPLRAVLNYIVPFCVSAYSGWRSLKNRQARQRD